MFSLVADYSDTSSSSEDTEDEEQQQDVAKNKKCEASLTYPNKTLLPSANLLLNAASKSTGVVFNNPFLEAERAEIDKLQKHVKMVESEEHLIQKNGRKICWNNRKGRCRFGNKCKYAHDSDLMIAATSSGEGNDAIEELPNQSQHINAVVVKTAQLSYSQHGQFSEDSMETKNISRKRPGLGDSIVPGKKVMKHYQTTKLKTPT